MRPRNTVNVTSIADDEIAIPADDINLVLPPTLFGSPKIPGYYEPRFEVQYRRDGLWHGRADRNALIAAGIRLPELPPWIALVDALYHFARSRMAGAEAIADLFVSEFELRVMLAGGEDAAKLLSRMYHGDDLATVELVQLIYKNASREAMAGGNPGAREV